MKARRIAALLTAALLSLTALTACSGGGKDQGGASGGLLAQPQGRLGPGCEFILIHDL